MFRRRQRHSDTRQAEQSLAQAEAARAAQARKLAAEQPITRQLGELIEQNDLAYRLALSLGIYREGHHE